MTDKISDDLNLVKKYFDEICQIPRCSGSEEKICKYFEEFAIKNEFEFKSDEYNNVYIRVDATDNFKDKAGIILQAHSDMVCEKNACFNHDFTKDPIKYTIEGDKVISKNTTLGADNGIGVAIAMALATEEGLDHPFLELVFTSDEERGLVGAHNFDTSLLKGKYLINLDSTEEGMFVAGCAGGPAIKIDIPVDRLSSNRYDLTKKIKISGLIGGHSGEDIHRHRANAIKLLNRALNEISKKIEFKVCSFDGGVMYNAIPRDAEAIIQIDRDDEEKLTTIINELEGVFEREYPLEKDLKLSIDNCSKEEYRLSDETYNKLNIFNTLVDYGVIRTLIGFPEVVETSNSIGVVETKEDFITIKVLVRSSLESQFVEESDKIHMLAKIIGANIEHMSDTPAWEYNPNSTLLKNFKDTYKDLFDKEAEVQVLHAGLETGVFAEKLPEGFEMISVGPDIRDLHAPGEYLTISSLKRFWKFMKTVISRVN